MATRAKYKAGQFVEFRFAGSDHTGEIGLVKKDVNNIKYSIIDDEGTQYPVSENNIIRKL